MRTGGKLESGVFIFGGLSIFSTLLFPLILTMTTIWGIQNKSSSVASFWQYIKRNVKLILIETLRAWGKTFQGLLMLILPGLIRVMYYYLVPFVVLLSPDYANEKVDALQESKRVAKLNLFKLCGIIFVFGLVLPIYLSMIFDGFYILWKTPVNALLVNAIETYWVVFTPHLICYSILGMKSQV